MESTGKPIFSHVRRLLSVSHYETPLRRIVKPHRIESGVEYLELLTGGKIIRRDRELRRIYDRGTLFWHRAGEWTVCHYPPGEEYSCYVFRFAVEGSRRPGDRAVCPADGDGLLAFAERMFRNFHAGVPENPATAAMVYTTLAWYALGPRRQTGVRPEPLTAALRFMEQNFAAAPELNVIADSVGVSAPYLHALFQRHLQTTPHRYLLKLRIDRARQMLADTSPNIKTVAADCGFASLEVFFRCFRRLTGTTPGRYRQNFQPK